MSEPAGVRGRGEQAGIEDEVASRLLPLVHDLAVELHPRLRQRLVVELASDLDRDLGFDSLSRAELLVRIDQAFSIRLPDELIGEAETPRDFVRAIVAAGPAAAAAAPAGRVAVPLADLAAAAEMVPTSAETLLEVVQAHLRAHGERPHVILRHGEDDEEAISYADLDRAARAVGHGLLEGGLRAGDRVAIMLPTGAEFFHAFMGILYAGGVPVPIYPPFRKAQVEDHLRRQAGILRNAGANVLITNPEIRQVGSLLHGLAEGLRKVETVARLKAGGRLRGPIAATAGTTALIQYTSGSTGDPKGVVLSHANLLANIRAMGEALDADASDVFVSWLPLYHDMGLIGAWLACLYYAVPTVIMSPLYFLADPVRWLRAIHQHRATLTAAPNFAFELCLRGARDDDLRELDLGSLRMVANGAEPVSPGTLAGFAERFAPFGFHPEAMAPVYGLAENAVGLAFPPVGRGPVIDRVDREALSRGGTAKPARADDPTALEFVTCGRPIPGHQVRIVDPGGRELPERQEGRLQFTGPSSTVGYFESEEKSRELFDGEWLESGDRAYIAGGDIFITGRIKDMIIRAGRNIYPHELEELVGKIDGVRRGCVAAFASPDPNTGSERLIVVAETRLKEADELDELRRRIAAAAVDLLAQPPDDIVLPPPHTLPKTSSGKLRRSSARALFENDALRRRGHAFWWQLARLILAGGGHRVRRAGQALSALVYAGYWWSVLALFVALVWLPVLGLPRRGWRHAIVRLAARGFLRSVGMRPAVTREAAVPDGGLVYVINHASYLDMVVLSAVLPGALSFIAKGELTGQILVARFLRNLGTLFVRRIDPRHGIEDTAQMLAAAAAGERLVWFPEGTLTRMPGLLGFHLGAFMVAAEGGVPAVPVALRGTRSILRDGQWFPRCGTLEGRLGRALTAREGGFSEAIRLRDSAREFILEHSHEPDLAHEQVDFRTFATE
ncbi:MAG: AMP-binding protein [Alphaproteobacteria bacterium]|nr:AMP-binding protein [Alphaproteobacteria bacterium]